MRHKLSACDGKASFNRGLDRFLRAACVYPDLLLDRFANEGKRCRLSGLPDATELI